VSLDGPLVGTVEVAAAGAEDVEQTVPVIVHQRYAAAEGLQNCG
jgi:hypothetical protein